ncbi:hypothetical protein [Candidatus Kinetoplastibacterium sorsogonicusi]|uniref:hypothetical protein n=1 Tax=Candidatus Kinetoplastidibacterium kentomonadis TaxID=1576550 RepID=UPI000D3E408C|nr:hypothetical protein [Candidatus Kinetoplastibacterium sorsogonicusi]
MKNAKININQINFITVHDTSNKIYYKNEIYFIKIAFGSYAYVLFLSFTKSMIGNVLSTKGYV